jgi:hypothetical protein
MKRRIIIVGIIVLVAIVLIVVDRSNQTSNDAVSTNAPSGPTISSSSLINAGVTSEQLGNFEQALEQYLSSQNLAPKKISFSSINRIPPNPNATGPFSEIDFTVQLDGSNSYQAKLDSFSLSDIKLYLYSPSGNKLLYNSQDVGSSS